MEKALVKNDTKSFEYLSPSELDRNFLGEQSLLSLLSMEQLTTSMVPSEAEADGSDAWLIARTSLCLSLDPISPSEVFSTSALNAQETDGCHLTVPPQGKFSTPQVLCQKKKKVACFYQLYEYDDLNATRMSWDVSLIKPECNSPKQVLELSNLDQTWSPKLQSTQRSPAGVSP